MAVEVDGEPPQAARLQLQVDAAESELRRLGIPAVRVHAHGELARLEVPTVDIADVVAEPLRGEVLRAVRSAGFEHVAVDLAGLESTWGSRPLAGSRDA